MSCMYTAQGELQCAGKVSGAPWPQGGMERYSSIEGFRVISAEGKTSNKDAATDNAYKACFATDAKGAFTNTKPDAKCKVWRESAGRGVEGFRVISAEGKTSNKDAATDNAYKACFATDAKGAYTNTKPDSKCKVWRESAGRGVEAFSGQW